MWQFDKYSNTFIPNVLPVDDSKITACYTRLSQEDEQEGESGSILNQRDFLLKYCKEQGLNNVYFFSDDGYTGTNFDRPGFTELMELVERRQVQTISVKDACDIIRLNAKPLWHNGLAFSSKILVAFLTPLLFGISRGVLIFL